MGRRHVATATLAVLSLIACSGDDGNEAFCDDMVTARRLLGEASTGSSDDMTTVVEQLDDIDPPEAIEEPYQRLVDLYTAIAETGSITDPEISSKLADSQADLAEVDGYVADRCSSDKPR